MDVGNRFEQITSNYSDRKFLDDNLRQVSGHNVLINLNQFYF